MNVYVKKGSNGAGGITVPVPVSLAKMFGQMSTILEVSYYNLANTQ